MSASLLRRLVMGVALVGTTSITVVPSVVLADSTAGYGATVGVVGYSPGVPAVAVELAQPCAGVSWSDGNGVAAAGAVVNTASNAYVGPATLALSGSGCENMGGGNGTASASLNGTVPITGSTISCAFSGTYSRIGLVLLVDGPGTCTVDGWPTGTVYISARLVLAPINVGGGVLTSMSSAAIAGGWELAPGH